MSLERTGNANGSAWAASSWAKAPAFADRPDVAEQIREQTVSDRQEYLEGGMRPVMCRECGASVLAKKNSDKHTSIQWNAAASRQCPVLAKPPADNVAAPLADACPSLEASIETAAKKGQLNRDGG